MDPKCEKSEASIYYFCLNVNIGCENLLTLPNPQLASILLPIIVVVNTNFCLEVKYSES